MVSQAVKELLSGTNELFSLPDIYFQLNEMMRDQRFSMADIGKVISKDPGLSARLLRLVNSPYYGFQSKIDTITRAITVVGIDELYHLIVATCIVDRFDKIPGELVNMTDFWMHSMHCAVVAKSLAKQSLVLHSERLFLAGLLHDIGSLVLYRKIPEKALEALIAADYDRRLLADFEQKIIGFTHADVSGELIRGWGLPESLYEAVGCYLTPELARLHRLDAYILHVAVRLVAGNERGVPFELAADELSEHILSTVRLNKEQIVSVMERETTEFLAVFDLMAPNKRFH